MKRTLILSFILFCCIVGISAQGFLHTNGKYIYSGNGDEVILRGIGTGNWMIQEGYMMKTSDVAGTQHEFRAKLIATIGQEKTDSFYTSWLQNHMTRTDIDSMKAWGFNSIRVAMHYNWFTPPIEEEPVAGQITWKETGFNMIDSLLDWCSDNEMYLILDMHGAPGGQGKDAAISDYDASKPSLWESQANKNKLIALWYKLADRYKNEAWIGGYDLINEPNWDFENSGNQNGCNCNSNTPLKQIYEVLIDTIRAVDQNHIVIIEGNCWGNRYNGMTSLYNYDDNLVVSFHKYWNHNNTSDIQGFLDLRNTYNVPVWLGESGENSNTWFTNAIALCEQNRIGWSWWPVKKNGINNILGVVANADYLNLIEYWKGNAANPGVDAAFQAVLKWSDNHRFENCIIQRGVIDAMIRQPFSYDAKVYHNFKINEVIYAVEYDMGRNNVAYFDVDTADYHTTSGTYTAWNSGHTYRNDGVDMEACTDALTNGYNLGWSADKEWMQYTVTADSAAAHTLQIRQASGGTGSRIHIEIDGVPATKSISLPATGGWQSWQTFEVQDIVFPAGTHKVKFYWEKGGSNLNYFRFVNPKSLSSIKFESVYAETSSDGNSILLALNMDISSDAASISAADFTIMNNDTEVGITGFEVDPENSRLLKILLEQPVYYGTTTTLSYNGTTVKSNSLSLEAFSNLAVVDKTPMRYTLPAKIQAEDFYYNNGLVLETCTDAGGGQNTGYAASGDYLDYLVYVADVGNYTFNFRVATTASNARLIIQHNQSGTFESVDTIAFASTGGWQTWNTQTTTATLPAGRYTLRLLVMQGEHNLNWFEIIKYTAVRTVVDYNTLFVYPNPASNNLSVVINEPGHNEYNCAILDIAGRQVLSTVVNSAQIGIIEIDNLENGMYYLVVYSGSDFYNCQKIIKQ